MASLAACGDNLATDEPSQSAKADAKDDSSVGLADAHADADDVGAADASQGDGVAGDGQVGDGQVGDGQVSEVADEDGQADGADQLDAAADDDAADAADDDAADGDAGEDTDDGKDGIGPLPDLPIWPDTAVDDQTQQPDETVADAAAPSDTEPADVAVTDTVDDVATPDAAADAGAADAAADTGGDTATQDAGSDAKPFEPPPIDWAPVCFYCHGDAALKTPAPPVDTKGQVDTKQHGVGAHASHVGVANWHKTVACAECHKVPKVFLDPDTPSHLNGATDLMWGPLAKQGDYNFGDLACGNTYCHGASLKPDFAGETTVRKPTWTTLDGSQEACGSACHTNPPGGAHPPGKACQLCHTAALKSYDAAAKTAVWNNANLHIDGKVDVELGATCTSCHGDPASKNPAPPLGTKGETKTSDVAVGAHAKHLQGGTQGSTWHRAVQCRDCHTVPVQIPHANGAVELNWSPVAASGGTIGTWDEANSACANTWCHGGNQVGAKAGGTTNTKPVWTKVDGSQAACGTTCHTNPPGGMHPKASNCAACHGPVIASYDPTSGVASWANANLHVDGKVDTANLGCTTCHGDEATKNPAPPKGTQGETATTSPAVGAHAAHLGASAWHRAGECTDCHSVPSDPMHANDKVELNWGALAKTSGAKPDFDAAKLTCNASYCHGATLEPAKSGGTVMRQPQWTKVDGSQDTCGTTCHTNPPGAGHPASTACGTCHGDVVKTFDPASGQTTWTNAALHIDGKLQIASMDCTTCHGDKVSNNPAPPKGSKGETATTARAVGAHAAHLTAADWHRDTACTDCHAVPKSNLHSDGTVDLAWGALAQSGGAQTTWDTNKLQCSGNYCHGATLAPAKTGGSKLAAPTWTTVDNSQDKCGATCHTNPPGGKHAQVDNCQACHGAVIKAWNATTGVATWQNGKLHVDGTVQVANADCTTCHGDATTKNPAPPKGTKGETATTTAAVGAHTAHLGTSTWHRAGQCTDCHAVPTQMSHADSKIDFAWGSLTQTGGTSTNFDLTALSCTGSYCHGATLGPAKSGGTTMVKPTWNKVDGSQAACGTTCHTNPPGGGHSPSTACATCHTDVIKSYDAATGQATWANAALHVDGKVQVAGMDCTTCHGDATTKNPAPPKGSKGETATTARAVGAHAAHLTAADWHRDTLCTDCHSVPSSNLHSNNQVDLAWGAVAQSSGAKTTWDTTKLQCSGNYCHGATLAPAKTGGSKLAAPTWTTVDNSQDKCGSTCHTNPPGGGHAHVDNCQACHGEVIKAWNPSTGVATWQNGKLHVDGTIQVGNADCTTCHGDAATNNPAPPKGTKGETATTAAAVGAHRVHLGATTWHRAGQCTDCHTIPTSMSHANNVLDLAWGSLTQTGGANTNFEPSTLGCTGSYCHGATLMPAKAGGTTLAKPIWNKVDGSQDACGSTCHTNPPGGSHPASTACATCHGASIKTFDAATGQATWTNANLHVNGKVELSQLACTSCHGDPVTGAANPPLGTQGQTQTTQKAVGAHQAHLGSGGWHRAGQCADCHTVPTSMTHTDGKVDLAWSSLAQTGTANPTWDGSAATCSGNYCHGSTLAPAKTGGQVQRTPAWTKVDGSQDACGTTCHTNPPGASHPKSATCNLCHDAVISSFDPAKNTAVWKNPLLHVNGNIEVKALDCTTCHGDATSKNPAPPVDTLGNTATTAAGVGAHAQHLGASTWHRAGQCADCHTAPTSNLHANGALDLAWGTVPLSDAAKPAYDQSILTCTGSYCHGTTLMGAKSGGGTNRQPIWNVVNNTFDACGSTCHTNPPGGTHPASAACATCHPATIAAYNATTNVATFKDATLHINGKVDVVGLACTTCHGDAASNNPAPPLGTKGETATTTKAVGAHAKHGGSSTWHRDVACTDCHSVPASMTHSNGSVDLSWSSVASADQSVPAWNSATTTCSGNYCHGSSLLGAKAGGTVMRTPVWTKVDGSQAACGTTCHTLPPGGTHPQNNQCATCHTTVIASNDPATTPVKWADRKLHIDGKIDVGTLTCTSCHGDKASNNPAPPVGTKGETATSSVAVGAHAQHLGASSSHRPGQCTDCHVVPVSLQHGNGTTEMTWGALPKTASQTPLWDKTTATCAGNYCHGTSLEPAKAGGTTMRTPKWTQVDGSQGKCGSTCHTNPPGGPHPASDKCAMCHSAVISGYDTAAATATWKDPGLHVDGTLQVTTLTCTSCHGTASTNDPMPPKGTLGETATTTKAVGAHKQHLGSSAWHRAGACVDCHTVPTSQTHTNNTVDLAWGSVATAGTAQPAWNTTAATCSGNWCHGGKLPGANAGGTVMQTPKWTLVDGSQAACGTTCHTNPPGGSHPQSTNCNLCHAGVIASYDANAKTAVWKNATLHVDGNVDVVGMSCTSCHGDAAANDPSPPLGTKGETQTTQVAVGAHAQHMGPSNWRGAVLCSDCHTVPTSMTHTNGTVDVNFAGLSVADTANPTWSKSTVTCSGSYCHGATLMPAATGGTVNHNPLWTKVDGSQDACGSTCHTNPPGGTHPPNTACNLCHNQVIGGYDAAAKTATWADPTLHINGKVEVKTLTCTSCHGDTASNNPAPPLGTKGETQTSQAAVGAHAQHLATSTWHRNGQCTDCHSVPVSVGHANGSTDFSWGGPSALNGANPQFAAGNVSCSGAYCHGNTLYGPKPGGSVARTPVWTTVNGSWDACGTTCHTLPPAAPHPQNENCAQCHAAVVTSIVLGTPPTVVWQDAQLHIDGKIDTGTVTCTSCHGDKVANNPAPPIGSKGETQTTQKAVGAHAVHLAAGSTWHRDGQCTDCHTVPVSMTHANGTSDLNWSAPSNVGNLSPSYAIDAKCSNNWCHGSGLGAAKTGGTLNRTPLWTQVDGTQDACGTTCHTNPPGGGHVAHTDCTICHTAVVAAFNPANNATTWTDRTLHVNGVKESNKYHDLGGWTTPKFGTNHHGSNYFVRNQQRDEHNVSCTQCHGADLLGGTVGVSCANSSCHGGDWKSCDFCHGTKGGSAAPPIGVANEGTTATNTLAVGRHTAHLTASTTHVAFACTTCHTVPATGDLAHAMQYVYSANLTTAGHHGDVTFAGGTANGMTFNVAATTGNPVTARGTCVGTCHSNGRGGPPVTTPYWAGGNWNKGSCGTCHAAMPNTGEHDKHVNGENMTCVECHPAATAATHMNGSRDVLATIKPASGSGSTTTSPASGNCTTRRCSGSCHGENHSSRCW
ncbi:MAG: hypothetical protein HY902_12830 [Deltaproteobacteria bacterium]|nr:hypothetical protein [Deltaproteobacteria bacterium]